MSVTIGICAPSSCFDIEKFNESIAFLNSSGIKTRFSDAIFEQRGYLAGSDESRAKTLNELFADNNVDVIMCARGGYGSARIINLLDLDIIRAHPKVFIGASDVCSVLYFLMNNTKCKVFFGPFLIEVNNHMDTESLDLFLKTVRGSMKKYSVTGLNTLLRGSASGGVTGGCLTIMEASLKTSHEIHTDGKIIFIEDVAEPLYKIDRSLTHLKNAGKFRKIKGVIAGGFPRSDFTEDKLHNLLTDIFGEYKIPVVSGFPAGHGEKKLILPFSGKIELNADMGEVKYL